MPLIIVTGLPTSGKSTRAGQLHEYLSKRIAEASKQYRLHLISDDSLSISRSVYDLSSVPAHVRSANASEKDARALLYGAVKRVLSDKDIVILDGLNYIKGWRYQLHYRAKAVNEERLAQRDQTGDKNAQTYEPYEPGNWENLVFRHEEPNPMTRWDSPLFTLIWEDEGDRVEKVFGDLWEAIAGDNRKVVRPNQATVQRSRDAGGDYLHLLDRETQLIVKRILDQQGDEAGGEVKVPLGADGSEDLTVWLPGKKIGLPQLQRHRRAFMSMNRGGIGLEAVGNMASDRLKETFVRYLNDAFENDE